MSGILDWAVEGCKKWQEEGLKKPISVIEATEDYKTDVDPTSLWIETRYTGNEADTVPTRLLFMILLGTQETTIFNYQKITTLYALVKRL